MHTLLQKLKGDALEALQELYTRVPLLESPSLPSMRDWIGALYRDTGALYPPVSVGAWVSTGCPVYDFSRYPMEALISLVRRRSASEPRGGYWQRYQNLAKAIVSVDVDLRLLASKELTEFSLGHLRSLVPASTGTAIWISFGGWLNQPHPDCLDPCDGALVHLEHLEDGIMIAGVVLELGDREAAAARSTASLWMRQSLRRPLGKERERNKAADNLLDAHSWAATVSNQIDWEWYTWFSLEIATIILCREIEYYTPRPKGRRRRSRRNQKSTVSHRVVSIDWARSAVVKRQPYKDGTEAVQPTRTPVQPARPYTGPGYRVGLYRRRVWVRAQNVEPHEKHLASRESRAGNQLVCVERVCNVDGYSIGKPTPVVYDVKSADSPV